ncbi:unnamed protein product [Cochlearia groenlandica]
MIHRSTPETTTAASRGCGEIVEVEGGHIVRSTGKKDRHSKVCTAKGTRDRRVRLSALTAIQFYDVQDRLGFDRPSKAVDWLIQKSKTSIDELALLPPWNPLDAIRNAAANAKPRKIAKPQISPPSPPQQTFQFGGDDNETSFLPPSMDSDSIADTIKTFFPVVGSSTAAAATETTNQLMMHHNYHHQHQNPPDLLSRSNSQNQDLRLSLQSFTGGPPSSLLHHHQQQTASASTSVADPVTFYGHNNPLAFDTSTISWEQQNKQSSDFGGGGGGGFLLAPPPSSSTTTSYQQVLGQSHQLYSQRGPLQSSYNMPMIRAWFDPNHHYHHQSISADYFNHHQHFHQSAIPARGEFSSGFRAPAGFHGQEEDGFTNKLPSTSSISRH